MRVRRFIVLVTVMTGLVGLTAVNATAAEPNSTSDEPVVSGNGGYVAFTSYASNLAAGDTNTIPDVFVRERWVTPGSTKLVSLSSSGVQANSSSGEPSISADGRYVAFSSYGSNLVAGDTNTTQDVFVRDRSAGTTTRVSISSAGGEANSSSRGPSISGDGRYVAFTSDASNLVAGDTSPWPDVFVRDRWNGTTTRVSVGPAGVQANSSSGEPSISADGRYVAFSSYASNLVAGDTNTTPDVFVYDRTTATTTRVSLGDGGQQGNSSSGEPSISGDGRHVAFSSYASNLVEDLNGGQDVFDRDRVAGTTKVLSFGGRAPGRTDGGSYDPSISSDGSRVAFVSSSQLFTNDVNTLTDIYENLTAQTAPTSSVSARLSYDDFGNGAANGTSSSPSLSSDGNSAAFASYATNFARDLNGVQDIYVHNWVSTDTPTPYPPPDPCPPGTFDPCMPGTTAATSSAKRPASSGSTCTQGGSSRSPSALRSTSSTSPTFAPLCAVSRGSQSDREPAGTIVEWACISGTWHIIITGPQGGRKDFDTGVPCGQGESKPSVEINCINGEIVVFIYTSPPPRIRIIKTNIPC